MYFEINSLTDTEFQCCLVDILQNMGARYTGGHQELVK